MKYIKNFESLINNDGVKNKILLIDASGSFKYDLKKYFDKLIYIIPALCSSLFFLGLSQYSLWYDELQTWATVSKVTLSEFISYTVIKQPGPFLYYFFLWIFNPIVVWSELSLRIFSALFLAGSVFCFFSIIKKYDNTAIAVAKFRVR